jgi:predicted nuclease with RNAse H fold|tara:strand:- start:3178 stop:3450 length:273 start_codon:yes stop_codon:yes gene_type:complete
MKNLLKQILKIDNKADLDLIIGAVKMARAHIDNDIIAEAKAFFKVGDTVSFTCRKRGIMTGKITKMKIKRANVRVDGTGWDVPLTMLEAS